MVASFLVFAFVVHIVAVEEGLLGALPPDPNNTLLTDVDRSEFHLTIRPNLYGSVPIGRLAESVDVHWDRRILAVVATKVVTAFSDRPSDRDSSEYRKVGVHPTPSRRGGPVQNWTLFPEIACRDRGVRKP